MPPPQLNIELSIGSRPAPQAFYDALAVIEVEESSEQPGALLLRLPANPTREGDLAFVGDGSFEPLTPISVTVTPGGGETTECVFDGYVLAWRLTIDGAVASPVIEVWAHDASWLMNTEDKVHEWSGMTDDQVASSILGTYGFSPVLGLGSDSPSHLETGHTLMQRSTDLQFVRGLARRTGKVFRVACETLPGIRLAHFGTPSLSRDPSVSLSVGQDGAVDRLEFEWDVMRPTAVTTSQVDLTQPSSEIVPVRTGGSGLTPLGARSVSAYLDGSTSSLTMTAPADTLELPERSRGVLRESEFFARCTGEADASRLGRVLRVGQIVTLEGAGELLSGPWLVWSVRHRFQDVAWRMAFTLVRNAVGAGSLSASALGGLGL